jgi:hypothetical protein
MFASKILILIKYQCHYFNSCHSEVLSASIVKVMSKQRATGEDIGARRPSFIVLMMEALRTSETSVNFYETTRRNIPEDSHFHTRRGENLKSHFS